MRVIGVYIYKNAPTMRQRSPHNKRAWDKLVIEILNRQFRVKAGIVNYTTMAFFDRLQNGHHGTIKAYNRCC